MWPIVTYLEGKLGKMYFSLKKIKDVIDIYDETCEKADERFQSVYAEGGSLNKVGTEEPCFCGLQINQNDIPSEAVKQ